MFWGQHVKYLTKNTKEKIQENIKTLISWSAMRDDGLKFCQDGAVLGRIILEVRETHKKVLKNSIL